MHRRPAGETVLHAPGAAGRSGGGPHTLIQVVRCIHGRPAAVGSHAQPLQGARANRESPRSDDSV